MLLEGKYVQWTFWWQKSKPLPNWDTLATSGRVAEAGRVARSGEGLAMGQFANLAASEPPMKTFLHPSFWGQWICMVGHGWVLFKVLPRILMWSPMLLESHVLKDAAWPKGSGARACFYGAVALPSLSSSRGDPWVPHYIFLPPFKRRGPETVWVLKLKPTTETQKGKFWSWKHAGGQHAILILNLV